MGFEYIAKLSVVKTQAKDAATSTSLEEGGAAPAPVPRPTSHLRYNIPHGAQAPEIRPGTPRPRESSSITLDTYSHVIENMDGGLAEAMVNAL
jgi:hypothetical protein